MQTCSWGAVNDVREGVAPRAVGASPRLLLSFDLGLFKQDFSRRGNVVQPSPCSWGNEMQDVVKDLKKSLLT